MGCCGQKRREWLQEINKSSKKTETIDSENTQERKPKVFEYTGKHSLKIKGAITGNIFYFRFPGYKIEVPYEDSFAMMAETDLKVHTKLDNRSKK
jgi:hypothetical protein